MYDMNINKKNSQLTHYFKIHVHPNQTFNVFIFTTIKYI